MDDYNLSLEKVAEIVRNSVMSGLKGITNVNFSTEQLMDELLLTCNSMANELALQRKLDLRGFYQDINCIELVCKDISECCTIDTDEKVLMTTSPIPKPLFLPSYDPIMYLGLPNKMSNFKITNQLISGEYDKYSFSGRVGLTTAYLTSNNDIIIRNPPSNRLKYISITAVFETPQQVYEYECMCKGEKVFQRPQWLLDKAVGKIVNDYMRYYKLGAMTQPNTQEQMDMGNKSK